MAADTGDAIQFEPRIARAKRRTRVGGARPHTIRDYIEDEGDEHDFEHWSARHAELAVFKMHKKSSATVESPFDGSSLLSGNFTSDTHRRLVFVSPRLCAGVILSLTNSYDEARIYRDVSCRSRTLSCLYLLFSANRPRATRDGYLR